MMTQTEVPVNHSPSQSDLRILWLPALFCLILVAVEVYLLLHDWGSAGSSKASTGEPIAQFISGKNIVRQKTVGTLVWETPSQNMPLFRESAIATMDDSEAILIFKDNSELIVEPNSLLILEEAPSNLVTGGTGKIVARLVKGSIKRKNTGSTPFFIKLSRSKDAIPIQINDQRGDAVFRVKYRLKGYEVVVESGTIMVDGNKTLQTGEALNTGEVKKLVAPRLKKPKIEIIRPEKPSRKKSGAAIFWNFFISEAFAADSSELSIRFSWEETPEAASYLIQISKNPEFTEILSEQRTSQLDYHYKMAAPAEKTSLYFRVAGISGDGSIGDFSAIEKVDVKPDPKNAEPVQIAEETPKKIMPVVPIASPTPEPIVAIAPPHQRISLWYGIHFQQRKFKDATTNPKEVSGNGIIPTGVGVEFQRAWGNRNYFSAGGTFIFEKATPQLASPSNTAFSVFSLRSWITYGGSFEKWNQKLAYHFGPYLGTSNEITENGLLFESESKLLLGLIAALQSDPESTIDGGKFNWRIQLAALAIGSVGVDASAWLRKTLIQSGTFRGLFCGVAIETRLTGIESSWGTALEVGFGI